MTYDISFWKNKRVLITGHTGFVGTWLSLTLQYWGAETYGIALSAESGSLYERIQGLLDIKSAELDIRDKEKLEETIQGIRPEVVFHLAAFGFIQECYADPERAFSTNVMGTLNLMNAVKSCDSVKSLVIASSDKVYENNGGHHLFAEEEALGGSDPYSSSKACEDIVSRSFYDTYLNDNDIGMCVVRPSNILGGGDHHENRLIPSLIKAYSNGMEPEIRHPNAVRPWQDIFDMCDAYLFLANRMYGTGKCDIVNVGPEHKGVCTVGEISNMIANICGMKVDSDCLGSNNVEDDSLEKQWLGLSIDKIKQLAWTPKYELKKTLQNVYSCHLKMQNTDSKELYYTCMGQIVEYYNGR